MYIAESIVLLDNADLRHSPSVFLACYGAASILLFLRLFWLWNSPSKFKLLNC